MKNLQQKENFIELTNLNFDAHDLKYQTGEYVENKKKVFDNLDELIIDL